MTDNCHDKHHLTHSRTHSSPMASIFLISKVKMGSYNGQNQDQGCFYLKLGVGLGGQCLSLD